MTRTIYPGLKVRVRDDAAGVNSWNIGKVVTIAQVYGNWALYYYDDNPTRYRMTLFNFWNRFEPLEAKGPFPDDEPQVFNDVRQAPLGMILRYDLDGEAPSRGAKYPYVVRLYSGLHGWCRNRGAWVPIPADHEGAWLFNLKDVWPVPAQWTEAFEYPMPSNAILYVQRVMGADNA